jgi:hypothetical protein
MNKILRKVNTYLVKGQRMKEKFNKTKKKKIFKEKKIQVLTRSKLNVKEFKRKTPPVCIHVCSDAECA